MQTYITKANDLNLSEARYWKLLLHMPSDTSEIDESSFFLAKSGKTDAKAELNATLFSLYNESRFDDNATGCLYPARKMWLQKKLGLENLPEVKCQKFDKLLKKLDPKSVTLVFPNAHINSPASMFGHTFLRIDSSFKSKLLSFAVNYSADANSNANGAMYAIRGIFGGFAGYYSLLAYTDKLKEYRDTDRRDIWEYELNLSEEETKLMVYHIWELNRAYSWYYFLSENCSYNMLWLLEIARPSIYLRDNFTYFVTPPATIQAIYEENLVKKQNYRPSKRTIILSYEKKLGREKILLSKKIALGEMSLDAFQKSNLSLDEKRFMLEAVALLLEYYYLDAVIDQKIYAKRLFDTLSLRAKLGHGKKINIIKSQNPDYAHKTTRIRLESRYKNGNIGLLLGIRPSYHSLEDFNLGFLEGTQIEFFNTEVVYYDNKEFELEKLTLLSIKSYTQMSSIFKNIAYEISAGWNQNSLNQKAQFSLDGGLGISYGNRYGYIYGLSTYSAYLGSQFINNSTVSMGAKMGLVTLNSKKFQTNIEIEERYYDSLNSQLLFNCSESYRVEKNINISLSYKYIQKLNQNDNNIRVIFNYYF